LELLDNKSGAENIINAASAWLEASLIFAGNFLPGTFETIQVNYPEYFYRDIFKIYSSVISIFSFVSFLIKG